ncbi:MAG TPA: DUF2314 domain-containing protein [Vitreimonas sp.]|nr:DUF2314 domain-containing protein [Vitreimonas sp.]
MIIVWAGYGWLVPVIVIASLFVSFLLDNILKTNFNSFFPEELFLGIALLLSAAGTYWLNEYFNKSQGQEITHPQTGKTIKVLPNHTLYFVPIKYWAGLLLLGALYFAAIALTGGSSFLSSSEIETENTVLVNENDPLIAEAERTAQATLKEFIGRLNTKDPKFTYSIKTVIGEAEHIWVEVSNYEAGSFNGVIANEPFYEKYKLGDPIKVKETEVEDWIIHDENFKTVAGGFSIEALQEAKKTNQKK